MLLGELFYKISADISGLTASLNQAKSQTADTAKNIDGSTKNIVSSFLNMKVPTTAIVGALATVSGAILGTVKSALNLGDEMDRLGKKTGLPAQTLLQLQFAAEQSGTSLEAVATGFKFLSINAVDATTKTGNAGKVFESLGVSVKDSNGKLKDSKQLFIEVADKIAGIESPAIRTKLAVELFGKSGSELLPLLAEGGKGIQGLMNDFDSLGFVIDQDMVKRLDDLGDRFEMVWKGIKLFGTNVGLQFVPVLEYLVKQITINIKSWDSWFETIKEFSIKSIGVLTTWQKWLGDLSSYVAEYFNQTSLGYVNDYNLSALARFFGVEVKALPISNIRTRTVEETRDCLSRLAGDHDMRETIGASNRRFMEEHWNYKTIGAEWIKYYRSLL